MNLVKRAIGKTDINVFPIGFGAGTLGAPDLDSNKVEQLLLGALELGVNLFDTAPSYGQSEIRLGNILKSNRNQILLSTKVGYGVEGIQDWTFESVIRGIDKACNQLRTDYIDIVHLHSCSLATLKDGQVIEALLKAKAQGKIRFSGYSGDNEELVWAIYSGYFDIVQCSANICDRFALEESLEEARMRGIAVLAKRALANSVWMYHQCPDQHDLAAYFNRFQKLDMDKNTALEWAVRYIVHHPLITCALIGTTQLSHLEKNIAFAKKGPLAIDQLNVIKKLTLAELGPGIV
jgi:aryl-alcohol dehydrogenase-like predicted oxidoreductase